LQPPAHVVANIGALPPAAKRDHVAGVMAHPQARTRGQAYSTSTDSRQGLSKSAA
jgi:hypothetical protein